MPSTPPGSVLLYRPGAIGDSLLMTPVLAALRAARPAARLVLIAHPAVGELMLDAGLVAEFFSRDSPIADALFAPTPDLALTRLGRIGAAIVWTGDPDGQLTANLAALGAAPVVLRPSRPPDGSGVHVAAHLLSGLSELGICAPFDSDRAYLVEEAPPQPSVNRDAPPDRAQGGRGGPACPPWPSRRFHEAGQQQQDRPSSPNVFIHPGSGSTRKNWPAERYALLAEALWREYAALVTVLGGPADEDVLGRFREAVSCPHEVLIDQPLRELAPELAACDLYVGNDSGLSHLAGLVGAPTLALFGPTEPGLWRPLGSSVRVLRREPLANLAFADVLAAAQQALACGHRGRARPM